MLLILTELYECELLVLKQALGVALLPLAVCIMNIKDVRELTMQLYKPLQPGGGCSDFTEGHLYRYSFACQTQSRCF